MIMHFTTHPKLNHKPLTPTGVGAPDLTDIEITPAMIEAGLEELKKHPIMEPYPDDLRISVQAVFCSMLRVHRESVHGTC